MPIFSYYIFPMNTLLVIDRDAPIYAAELKKRKLPDLIIHSAEEQDAAGDERRGFAPAGEEAGQKFENRQSQRGENREAGSRDFG